MSYALFPDLPGRGWSIMRRPKHSVSVQTHVDGSEVRLSYWSEPLWEWDLTYDLLRDRPGYDELRQIVGLFLACSGNLIGFQFRDTDDCQVVRQPLGITDGSKTAFDLVRTYGANAIPGYRGTEKIGFLDQDHGPFALYVDDAASPVPISDPTYGYALSLVAPRAQQIVFTTAPPAGHALTATFAYRWYVRFSDQMQEFEKFAETFWQLQKLTLMSLRS